LNADTAGSAAAANAWQDHIITGPAGAAVASGDGAGVADKIWAGTGENSAITACTTTTATIAVTRKIRAGSAIPAEQRKRVGRQRRRGTVSIVTATAAAATLPDRRAVLAIR
jgi:hypothetical protein